VCGETWPDQLGGFSFDGNEFKNTGLKYDRQFPRFVAPPDPWSISLSICLTLEALSLSFIAGRHRQREGE
jgi:hypothetical protein